MVAICNTQESQSTKMSIKVPCDTEDVTELRGKIDGQYGTAL